MRYRELEDQINMLKEKLEGAQSQLKERDREIESKDDMIRVMADQLNKDSRKIDELNRSVNELSFSLSRTRQTIEDLNETIRDKDRNSERLSSENQVLKTLCSHDPLTKIHNRYYLEEIIKYNVAQKRREYQEDISDGKLAPRREYLIFIFMDIDDLKVVNDKLGHCAGDCLLVAFASQMQEIIRQNEIFARIGGDEFVVLLTGHDRHKLRQSVKRFWDKMKELRFEFDGAVRPIEISMGTYITVICEKFDLRRIMIRADVEMYRIKNAKKTAGK